MERFAALIVLVSGGCGGRGPSYPGKELDQVARSIERFGTVSISGATLIEPDPRFQLDLNLTGNQIFERNPIEGFSNISQHTATDLQISLQAEVIANVVDQMKGTTDPKPLAQLKEKLQGAAFQALADHLPEELKPFADALRAVGPPVPTGGTGGAGAGPGLELEDGGLAEARKAEQKLKEVKAAIEESKKNKESAKAETDEGQKKTLARFTIDKARHACDSLGELAGLMKDAAKEAKDLAVRVSEMASASSKYEAARTEAQQAITAAQAAEDIATGLLKRTEDARKKIDKADEKLDASPEDQARGA